MTALRKQMHEYIDNIPESKLLILKPLFHLVSEEVVYVEPISFGDLEEDEKAAVIQGRKDYEEGLYTDFEDVLREKGIDF
jgi:hypothetical protein